MKKDPARAEALFDSHLRSSAVQPSASFLIGMDVLEVADRFGPEILQRPDDAVQDIHRRDRQRRHLRLVSRDPFPLDQTA